LVAGDYTVTPSKTGYVYTPAITAVTVSNANVTANFNSAVQTFTISGTISGTGGNGASVALSGAKAATTTTNSSGAYSFTGLANGSYTVIPSKTGYAFTPVNQAVTLNGANASANFSATAVFNISGTISGAGGNGATLALSGAKSATATANSSGAYSFTALLPGSYTVTPSKTGYVFTPAKATVTISTANVIANFTSAVPCTPTPIVSYIQVSGGAWQNTAAVTVNSPTTSVNLGPQPLTGSWKWTGPNGYTSTARQINGIPLTVGTDVYVATYTNSGGCTSSQAFTITVK
jgi:hypothetical protein